MMKQGMMVSLVGVCLLFSGRAEAQFRKEYTPAFLRAALGSLRDRTPISVTGEYDADAGLVEASASYLEDKGYSRFTVKDTETGVAFSSMYCHVDSSAFKELLKIHGRKILTFEGYKDMGDEQENAVFVTRVHFVSDVKEEPPAAVEAADAGRTLRVTITNTDTGNKTVLLNVVKGQSYKVDNLTVVVEDEAP